MKWRMVVSTLLVIVLVLISGNAQARWLDPASGRFQSMDSFEGNASDPQSLHKYGYAHGDPVNGIDPAGLTYMKDLMASIATIGHLAGNLAIRAIPLANRTSVILVEMASGTTVVGGGVVAGGVIKSGVIPKVSGGWQAFLDAAKRLRTGDLVGHHGGVKKVLEGTGRQSNHLNQFKAFERMIPEADGVAHAIDGDILAAGSAHNLFHKSLEPFWDIYRKNGPKYGQNPTCGEYGKALEKALQAAGKSVDESVALAEVANKNRQFYGLLDDDLVPDIPGAIPNLK